MLPIAILCIQFLFKLGVSKKEHLRCMIVTGNIIFVFSFLQKQCFSKFNMIKAEPGWSKAESACWLVSQGPTRRLTKGELVNLTHLEITYLIQSFFFTLYEIPLPKHRRSKSYNNAAFKIITVASAQQELWYGNRIGFLMHALHSRYHTFSG